MLGHYTNAPFNNNLGQLHCKIWGESNTGRPLFCLPPAPFSSTAYHTIAPLLADIGRPIVAIDYPGYGGSAACKESPTITDYASAVQAISNDLYPEQKIDLLGFHTGCLVAIEASNSYPEAINRLILIDSPYFDEKKQTELLASRVNPIELKPELNSLSLAWEFCVSKKLSQMPLERAYEMFVDHIRSGQNTNQAFVAAFSYPCKHGLQAVKHTTDVIATKSGLYQPTINTASEIPHSTLHDLTEIDAAVLEQGAPTVAKLVRSILGKH